MENDLDKEPASGAGTLRMLLPHVICCGGILLFATGALSGVGTWLAVGGTTWLLMGAIVALAGYALWRRQRRGACAIPCEPAKPETPSRRSKAA